MSGVLKGSVHDIVGKTITFIDTDLEIDFDPGQRADVISHERDADNVSIITVDFSRHDKYNKQFAKPTYYDKDGMPRLYWHETKFYPKDKKTTVYYDEKTPPFTVGESSFATLTREQWNKIIELVGNEKLKELGIVPMEDK